MKIEKHELYSSQIHVLRDLKKKAKNKPAGFVLVQNYNRKKMLEEDLEELAKEIKKEAEDVPFIMMFSESEYGRGEDTSNHFARLMLSDIAICI